ncbi:MULTISPECIES: helix-turn-helix domain-containing protein [unclassified Saccharicrinis]|uniref:helix-turn-helix domain-containing protein n=1 Tax=unclassified Saccharicrinis TaxID=2646859 RepID=UPI003D35940B
MKSIPDIIKINQSLDKVVNHYVFTKSPRNARLLSFLVGKAVEGEDIKEHIIGVELFQNNYNPDSNDGRVRVYMFNLRKKLDEYYQAVGEQDEVIFRIEKGQYNVHFIETLKIENSDDLNGEKKSLTNNMAIILAGIVLALSALVFVFYPKDKSYCWDDYFSPKAQNICVIADHLICEKELEDGSWMPVHIKGINSQYELSKYMSDNNITDLRAADYTMMTKMAPYALHELDRWFYAHDNKFEVRLESELRLEQVRDYNIIYVGQFKTMNASDALFLSKSKVFSKYVDGFMYKDGTKKLKYTTHNENGRKTEYAMVSCMPLKNNNVALFLTSNNDIGTLATVRNFTNQVWLDEFFNELPKGTKHFNALFKVTGIHRTDMTCELVHVEVM